MSASKRKLCHVASQGDGSDSAISGQSEFESQASFDNNEASSSKSSSTKRKTRNESEKKRRDQFNLLINELCAMVSINKKKMDKSTVLKSTIAYLKNHQEISAQSHAHEIPEDWKPSFLSNDEFSRLMLEALDSFIIVFNQSGVIFYTSESVTSLLGYLPNELVNQSLFNYIHNSDHPHLQKILSSLEVHKNSSLDVSEENVLTLSFKCLLRRGSIEPGVTHVYENVSFNGTFHQPTTEGDENSQSKIYQNGCYCYCTVRLESTQILREMSITEESVCEFTSRLSMEWKYLYLDHRAPPIIGYLPFEVLGTSGYDYYHSDDLIKVAECHEQLLTSGDGASCCYRFLTKGRQWIWMKSNYYITYNQWNSKPEFIVCSNKIISYDYVKSEAPRESDIKEERMTNDSGANKLYRVYEKLGQRYQPTSSNASEPEKSQQPHSTNTDSPPLHKVVSSQIDNLLQHYLKQQQSIDNKRIQTPRSVPETIRQKESVITSSAAAVSTPRVSTSNITVRTTGPITNYGQTVDATRSDPAMSQIQNTLQEQLLMKSDMLQKAIQKQQDELHAITQQLAMSKRRPVNVSQSRGSRSENVTNSMMHNVQLTGQSTLSSSGVIMPTPRQTNFLTARNSHQSLQSQQRRVIVPGQNQRQTVAVPNRQLSPEGYMLYDQNPIGSAHDNSIMKQQQIRPEIFQAGPHSTAHSIMTSARSAATIAPASQMANVMSSPPDANNQHQRLSNVIITGQQSSSMISNQNSRMFSVRGSPRLVNSSEHSVMNDRLSPQTQDYLSQSDVMISRQSYNDYLTQNQIDGMDVSHQSDLSCNQNSMYVMVPNQTQRGVIVQEQRSTDRIVRPNQSVMMSNSNMCNLNQTRVIMSNQSTDIASGRKDAMISGQSDTMLSSSSDLLDGQSDTLMNDPNQNDIILSGQSQSGDLLVNSNQGDVLMSSQSQSDLNDFLIYQLD